MKTIKLNNISVVTYRALSYRWEDTPNPEIENVEYFSTKEEAIKHAMTMQVEVGFTPHVEKLTFNAEDIDLYEIDEKEADEIELIWEGILNKGEKLNEDGVLVYFKHHMYMNYAFDITGVEFVSDSKLKYEYELINNSDSLSSTYIAYFESLEEMIDAFEKGNATPFDKIHKGTTLVQDFIEG